VEGRQRWECAQWECLGFSRCVAPRWVRAGAVVADIRHRTHAERRRNPCLRISHVGSTGAELPPGRGTPKEGEKIFAQKCAACHGKTGTEGRAPVLKGKAEPSADTWARGRILPIRSPFATTVWDYINRAMPLNREGTLTADEVYALTAFLLRINDVVPEDQVLDARVCRRSRCQFGDKYTSLPDWKAQDAKA